MAGGRRVSDGEGFGAGDDFAAQLAVSPIAPITNVLDGSAKGLKGFEGVWTAGGG